MNYIGAKACVNFHNDNYLSLISDSSAFYLNYLTFLSDIFIYLLEAHAFFANPIHLSPLEIKIYRFLNQLNNLNKKDVSETPSLIKWSTAIFLKETSCSTILELCATIMTSSSKFGNFSNFK